MHKCYAMQILKAKKKKKKQKKQNKTKQKKPKQNNKRIMVTKSIEMKHKDHVKKTQLN